MKLLGWRPKNFKNFALGNACTCLSAKDLVFEQQCYHQPILSQNSLIRVSVDSDQEEKESIPDIFQGFLAIGTLGSESITTEPTTPRFSKSLENVIEKEIEVTDIELKLINYELDKFLEAEDEGNESSERSSYASIITLSGKQIEAVEAEEFENTVVCPLQNYLFGSLVEVPQMSVELKKEKTSLEELFKNDKIGNEQQLVDIKEEKKFNKGKYVSGLVKKMFKKLSSSSKSSTVSGMDESADAISNKKKLPKVIKIFCRKIHPEKSPAEKKLIKSQICEIMGNPHDSPNSKGYIKFKKNSTEKAEHWIKTDADYVVLEL